MDDILNRFKQANSGFDIYYDKAIDEIERNREAIAELVLFIKEILRVEPAHLHLFDRRAVEMLVAKYDNTKEGE